MSTAGVIRLPRIPSTRAHPLPSSRRAHPLTRTSAVDSFRMILLSQQALLGERVFPFAGIHLGIQPEQIAQIRWRKDGGGWNTVSVGSYTDLLQAARLVTSTLNTFATHSFDLEITDADSNVVTKTADILVTLRAITKGRVASIDKNFLPYNNVLIAADPTQIASVSHEVTGDGSVAKAAIDPKVLLSGSHDGGNNEADLEDSGQEFEEVSRLIRLNKDIVKNTTDVSQGVITGLSGNNVVATLAGGTDDDWDTNDDYEIIDGDTLDLIARKFETSFASGGNYLCTLYVEDQSANEVSVTIQVQVA